MDVKRGDKHSEGDILQRDDKSVPTKQILDIATRKKASESKIFSNLQIINYNRQNFPVEILIQR